jgi:hypothetical protein
MGLAFVNAAQRSIIDAGVNFDEAAHVPSIPWVARRIATMQGKVGLITEPSSRHNLAPKVKA